MINIVTLTELTRASTTKDVYFLIRMTKLQRDLGIALILCFGLLTTLKAQDEEKHQEQNIKPNQIELRFVSVLFRHGDRTVDTENNESFPNDPYRNKTYYPDGSGQLTIVGKRRLYNKLGKMLKKRYGQLLGKVYYPPNVYSHASPIERTQISLQIVLSALYSPIITQKLDSALLWQPISYKYLYDAQDMLLFPVLCPVFYRLYQNMLQTLEVEETLADFADLREELMDCTGKNITTLYGCFLAYGTWLAETGYGLVLPPCAKKLFSDPRLTNAVIVQMKLFSYGQLNRLNGGVLLRQIINDMDKKINGTLTDRKINVFSGHDLTVAALLIALNIFNDTAPTYTSCIMIELHEQAGKFFVKVLYYLGIPEKVEEKVIPGCELLCPYDKFVELLSQSIATTDEMTCPERMETSFNF